MKISIPNDVVASASAINPGRGLQKMEALKTYAQQHVPEGEQIVDWERDDSGTLFAITGPIGS
jgi:hypothetical protein